MDNVLPFKMLMKGTFNGILTALGGTADEITNDDFPEEGIELLRKAYLYYYKDENATASALSKLKAKRHPDYDQIAKATSYNQITYAMISDLFNLDGSFFRDFESGGMAEDLKLVLGNFTVKAVEEDGVSGFRIYDKYDYPNNDKWFQGQFPEIYNEVKESGYDMEGPLAHMIMSAKSGSKKLGEQSEDSSFTSNIISAFYPLAHSIGGWSANENRPDDEKLNVNVFIPFESAETYNDGEVSSVEMPEPPKSRPDDLIASAVVPNGPMDKQRASAFNNMINYFIPEAQASTIEPVMGEPVIIKEETKPLSFGETFKQARADGLKEFEFTNKAGKTGMFTTEVAQ